MADELTVSGTLNYADSEGSDVTIDFAETKVTVGTKKFIHAKMNVGITEEAIPLGEVTSPGYAIFKNLDETNFIEVRVGTGSTKMVKLGPSQQSGPFRFGSGVTAPYAISDTAACQMEYLIVSN